jgi:hypothetical protein
MQTATGALGRYSAQPGHFVATDLPVKLSQPAGGMTGQQRISSQIKPPGERARGLILGSPQPFPQTLRLDRIRRRSSRAFTVLVTLWLSICAFVLLALWLKWEL